MNSAKPILEQHAEHLEWLNKLSFYKDDMGTFQRRLNEIAKKNTSMEIMAVVEQLQNKLKIHNEQADILKHEINEHEKAIERSIIENPVASDHRKGEDHKTHREKMETFELLFAEFRKTLLSFCAKWM